MLSFQPFFVVLLIVTLSVTEGRPTVEDDEIEMVNATMEMDIEENGAYSQYVDYTPPPYECSNSLDSVATFFRCAQRNTKELRFVDGSLTREQIMSSLNEFCRMKPAILSCTLERAINCSAEVQQGLIQGGQTDFVCEAGGTGNVHPNVQYIFERLGEEGITEFRWQDDCRVDQNSIGQRTCHMQGFEAADIETFSHGGYNKQALEEMALPEFFEKSGRYVKAMTECSLRGLPKEVSNQTSCNWKTYVIFELLFYYPQMLGFNFPFTRNELDELFQFGNENNV